MWKGNHFSFLVTCFNIKWYRNPTYTCFPNNVSGPSNGDEWTCSAPALSKHPVSQETNYYTNNPSRLQATPCHAGKLGLTSPCLLCPHRQHLSWLVHMNSLTPWDDLSMCLSPSLVYESYKGSVHAFSDSSLFESQQNAYHMLTAPRKWWPNGYLASQWVNIGTNTWMNRRCPMLQWRSIWSTVGAQKQEFILSLRSMRGSWDTAFKVVLKAEQDLLVWWLTRRAWEGPFREP